jgi:hypothetical protein
MVEEERIEEISVINIDDMPDIAKEEVERKVSEKPKGFNFKGFAEVRMISASPMRIKSVEPIEGTDVDWIKKNSEDTEIDTSDIF